MMQVPCRRRRRQQENTGHSFASSLSAACAAMYDSCSNSTLTSWSCPLTVALVAPSWQPMAVPPEQAVKGKLRQRRRCGEWMAVVEVRPGQRRWWWSVGMRELFDIL